MSVNYRILPEHLRAGARRYIEDHAKPSGFLCGVLENNLHLTLCMADSISMNELGEIVLFWCCEAPAECWGSERAVNEWLKK